jgi:aldose 1-epimerase
VDHDPRSSDPRTIEAGDAAAVVDIAAGGRVAQISVGGFDLLIPPRFGEVDSTGWGSFPMAPFAGRIRHGRFRFLGVEHQLETNHQDRRPGRGESECQHAIHGTVFQRSWSIDDESATTISMHSPLTGRLDWPFTGTARQTITIEDRALRCVLVVDADDRAFPAEIGWHPWFAKPDRVEFSPRPPAAMYLRDELGLPTGELVEPPVGPWDDCFVHSGVVNLGYDRDRISTVTVTSDCDHWVVYDEPVFATCVEPQSGPPDAGTIRPRLVVPGRPLVRSMSIAW